MMEEHLIHVHPVNRCRNEVTFSFYLTYTSWETLCFNGHVHFVHQYSIGDIAYTKSNVWLNNIMDFSSFSIFIYLFIYLFKQST